MILESHCSTELPLGLHKAVFDALQLNQSMERMMKVMVINEYRVYCCSVVIWAILPLQLSENQFV